MGVQKKMVEQGLDLKFIWELWDIRCAQLAPLQHRLDQQMAAVRHILSQVYSPECEPSTAYSALLDQGEGQSEAQPLSVSPMAE